MFALIDCNNFFCSCERMFQPRYQGQGVAVLSSNDGCVIARSPEVKELGIPMGAPYFHYRALMHQHRVAVFSSNFALYGDLSARVMSTVADLYPRQEVYSIDECFVQLPSGTQGGHQQSMHALKTRIERWVGIPVSIGVAPTKTLAKLANSFAKNHAVGDGVTDASRPEVARLLMDMPVGDVWGIGRRWRQKLDDFGITTVGAFCALSSHFLRQHFGIIGMQLVRELQGVPSHTLNGWRPRKTIQSSASFAHRQNDLTALQGALAQHIARAAEQARGQRSCAHTLQVQLYRAASDSRPRLLQQTLSLENPGNDTSVLIHAAAPILQKLFRPEAQYTKVGVLLMLEQEGQDDLLNPPNLERQRLLHTMDWVNRKMGSNTLRFLATVQGDGATARRADFLSSPFTTSWQALPRVLA